ncbi:MAG: helix-turn-helix domain-containing protein [Nitrospirae bacterium]|nr:helix-turn-helix domain-containing protein [Nitrospirota bacterium]
MVNTIMTVKEVAIYLRLHESSIYRMCQAGDIPASKVGRGWRFKKDRIDAWLAQTYNESENKPLLDGDISSCS